MFTHSPSEHFLEQIALRTEVIDGLLVQFGKGIAYTRTRIWTEFCRDRSKMCISTLQNLQTALALSTRDKWDTQGGRGREQEQEPYTTHVM